MKSIYVDTLGFIGTFILGITLFPQVYKTFTEKQAKNLSLVYLILQFSANIIFIIYGYLINSWPVLVSNSIVSLCSILLIYAKLKFKEDNVLSKPFI